MDIFGYQKCNTERYERTVMMAYLIIIFSFLNSYAIFIMFVYAALQLSFLGYVVRIFILCCGDSESRLFYYLIAKIICWLPANECTLGQSWWQCCGSMTLCTDPDPRIHTSDWTDSDPDPAIFVTELQDSN